MPEDETPEDDLLIAKPAVRRQGVDTFAIWGPKFLAALPGVMTYTGAARAAGISLKTVERRLKANPQFAETVALAMREVANMLESVAIKRAINGSDRMLEICLKAHKPATYGDRIRQELTGPNGERLDLTLAEARALIERLGPAFDAGRGDPICEGTDALPAGFQAAAFLDAVPEAD